MNAAPRSSYTPPASPASVNPEPVSEPEGESPRGSGAVRMRGLSWQLRPMVDGGRRRTQRRCQITEIVRVARQNVLTEPECQENKVSVNDIGGGRECQKTADRRTWATTGCVVCNGVSEEESSMTKRCATSSPRSIEIKTPASRITVRAAWPEPLPRPGRRGRPRSSRP